MNRDSRVRAALIYVALLSVTSVLSSVTALAREAKGMIDAATRERVLHTVLKKLNEQYVFPETARKMEVAIRERMARKEYDRLTDGQAFAETLTRDLREVCQDKHLRVMYSPDPLPRDNGRPMDPPQEAIDEMRRQVTRENFGFERVEVLPGNLGYLKINYFVDPEWMGDTLRAAFDYLGGTDALIIDLRDNGGSMSEQAIPRVCSYLFEKPTHINSLYWRPSGKTTDYYTLAQVPGKRYLNKPVYVLTSARTFSGAEEFAYDLQNLKRATLIGETTGGGANGGGDIRIDDHFAVWIPVGRAINPITKTNWEGVGVKPEFPVPAYKALHTARLLAIEALVDKTTDERWKGRLKEVLTELRQNPPAVRKITFRLKGFPDAKSVAVAGTFNGWSDSATRLTRQGDIWTTETEAEPGRHMYKFVIDGQWMTDPDNPQTANDRQFVNSLLIVP
ncbi:MAG: S41 family peptidase [Capsulimonadales bacterium]|nr:S41 family peptidase [Capsulimonadales bacterium]